ncbi:L-dopachrome tautomerase yellow-g2 [Leptinotarsa decemlineata]|uniref:Yellow-g2 n=1 Tax=Leptinotarsa decemlineata TaxID=7539 RepID=A0A290GC44_LEPDE|nr:major royal jelly protein 1 [Leptinotarsa decemlineata]XP_023021019.1 major royal jelly protein 1 [Leptinotarsa decemlineata]XP_023021020.1 major royal jelly protein 1 [Leptinotarsa decemlineata]ATB56347.1 yellow-g2 [Leptinotarsa decemlineata]
MIFRGVLVLTLALLYVDAQNTCDLIEWTGGQFDWPNEATKSIYKSSGRYIPKHIIATRAQIFKDDIFVALPRYKPGVPVTLARIGLKQRGAEAILTPFPCWASQEEGDCNALQSVVDLYLDENNILWVLDTGVVNSLEQPLRRMPPRVIGINVLNGKKVKTLDLCGLVAQASRLQYLVVEYAPDGRPFVYVSDAATRSILVFDVAGNRGYRVVLPKVVANCRRDVLYIALVHRAGCNNNQLIITYLSGARIFQIRTEYLRAGCAAGKIQDLGKKENKIVVLGTDLGNALFFRFEGEREVYRWEVGPCFTGYKVVYKSPESYLATHAIPDVSRRRIRVLESNFPDYIQNTVGCGANQRVSLMISAINKD